MIRLSGDQINDKEIPQFISRMMNNMYQLRIWLKRIKELNIKPSKWSTIIQVSPSIKINYRIYKG